MYSPLRRPLPTQDSSQNVGASFPDTHTQTEAASHCLEKGGTPGSRVTSPCGPPSWLLAKAGAGLGGTNSARAQGRVQEKSPPPLCPPGPKPQGKQTALPSPSGSPEGRWTLGVGKDQEEESDPAGLGPASGLP